MKRYEPSPSPQMMIRAIALALTIWGLFLAVGAVSYNFNPWRGVIIMACTAAFLGSWGLLLAQRKRRLEKPHPKP